MNKKIKNKLMILAVIMAITSLAFGCKKPEPDDPTVVTTATPAPTSDITDAPSLTEEPTTAPDVTDVPAPTDTPTQEPTAAPTAEPTSAPTPVKASIDDVLKVYDEYLDSYFEDNFDYHLSGRFNLALIDDDDIPELLITCNSSDGIDMFRYTDEGDIQYVGSFESGGMLPYISRKNIVCSSYSDSYVQDLEYFEIGEDGTTHLLAELHVDYLPDETANYFINGEQTDSDKFFEFQDTIFNNENYEGFYFAESQPYDAFFRSNRPAVLSTMYETALNGQTYNGYIPENIDNLMGEWQLESYKTINKTTFDTESFIPTSSFSATLNSAYDFSYRFEDTLSGYDYVVESIGNVMTYCDYQIAGDAPTEFFYCVSNDAGNPMAFITYYEDETNVLCLELVLFTGDETNADYHLFYTKAE